MKRLILFLLSLLIVSATFSQVTISDRMIIRQNLVLKSTQVDTITNDTTNLGPKSIMTAKAVRDLVIGRDKPRTLQQVLTAGSTLSANTNINANGTIFQISNTPAFQVSNSQSGFLQLQNSTGSLKIQNGDGSIASQTIWDLGKIRSYYKWSGGQTEFTIDSIIRLNAVKATVIDSLQIGKYRTVSGTADSAWTKDPITGKMAYMAIGGSSGGIGEGAEDDIAFYSETGTGLEPATGLQYNVSNKRLTIKNGSNAITGGVDANLYVDIGENSYGAEYKGNGSYTGFLVTTANGEGIPFVQLHNTITNRYWSMTLDVDEALSFRPGGVLADEMFRISAAGDAYFAGNIYGVADDYEEGGYDVIVINQSTGKFEKTTITGGELSDGDKGDITVGSSGTTLTIDNGAVTDAKINDVAWSKITGTPTTRSGYGITDAQPLDADLTTIAGLSATTDNFIVAVSSAWASRTPSQVKSTLSLNNVENTALSTWTGTSNITTLGTIGTGTWNATPIGTSKGGSPSGGETGQVLAKNSGDDYDYDWVTPSGISDGDKGDITVSSLGTVFSINDNAVTLAKMAEVSTATLLGRNTSGTGDVEALSVSTVKSMLSLNNVDNTSDATKNSASATLTNKSMSGSANTFTNMGTIGNTPTGSNVAITWSLGTGSTLPAATKTTAGVMTASDKARLDSNFYIDNIGDGAVLAVAVSDSIIGLKTLVAGSGIELVEEDSIITIVNTGGGEGGGGGSGTVNTGSSNRLAYYGSAGTTVDDLAAITANRALISDANGLPTHSSVTNTELGYLSGVTSAIQTQLNAKQTTISESDDGLAFSSNVLSLNTTPVELTDEETITWTTSSGINAYVILGDNRTLSIPSPQAGKFYTIQVIQDEIGGRELILPGGGTAILNEEAESTTTLVGYYNGTTWEWRGPSSGEGGGVTISFGTEGQIPVMNSDGDDFDYSDNFKWDGNKLTITSSGTAGESLDAVTITSGEANATSMLRFKSTGIRQAYIGLGAGDNMMFKNTHGTNANAGFIFLNRTGASLASFTNNGFVLYTSNSQRINAGTSSMSLNAAGADYDIIIKGDNVDNLFYVDASTDRVGIKTSTPSVDFEVNGEFKANNVLGDVYTPTLTAGDNVSGTITALQFHYIRVGDVITVTGILSLTPNSIDETDFYISLPVASDFSNITDVTGLGTAFQAEIKSGYITGDTTDDRVQFTFAAESTNAHLIQVMFQYKVN